MGVIDGGIKRKTKREQWRTKVEEGVSYSVAISRGSLKASPKYFMTNDHKMNMIEFAE